MIVPSTVSVKNWQTPYLLKVECLRLNVIWIPDFGAPIWHPLRRNPLIVFIAIQLFFLLTSNLKQKTSNHLEWVWIILGIILCLVGVVGSLLPLLPGPPIAYVGLLLQLFREPNPFEAKTYWIFGAVVVVSLVLDYLIPIWGTKKFGGTKYGAWGCTIGFLAAFWIGPWGVIIGPFVGAFIGEMVGGQDSHRSLKAALGSFVGFLLGSFLKIVVCFFMLYWIITSI